MHRWQTRALTGFLFVVLGTAGLTAGAAEWLVTLPEAADVGPDARLLLLLEPYQGRDKPRLSANSVYPGEMTVAGSKAGTTLLTLHPRFGAVGPGCGLWAFPGQTEQDANRRNETRRHLHEFTLDSRLLSAFHGKPVPMRAWVLLPDDYETRPEQRWPVTYLPRSHSPSRRKARWIDTRVKGWVV